MWLGVYSGFFSTEISCMNRKTLFWSSKNVSTKSRITKLPGVVGNMYHHSCPLNWVPSHLIIIVLTSTLVYSFWIISLTLFTTIRIFLNVLKLLQKWSTKRSYASLTQEAHSFLNKDILVLCLHKLTNAQIQTPDIPAKSRVSRSTGQTDKIVLIKRRFEILLQAWLLTINAGPGECSTEKYSTRALEEKRVLRDDSDGGTGKAMLVFSFFIKFSSSSRDCTHFHCISSAFVQDLDLKHSLIPRRRKSLMTPSVRLILAYGGSANTLTVTLFNGQFGLELLSLWRIEARPKSMNVAKTK